MRSFIRKLCSRFMKPVSLRDPEALRIPVTVFFKDPANHLPGDSQNFLFDIYWGMYEQIHVTILSLVVT